MALEFRRTTIHVFSLLPAASVINLSAEVYHPASRQRCSNEATSVSTYSQLDTSIKMIQLVHAVCLLNEHCHALIIHGQ